MSFRLAEEERAAEESAAGAGGATAKDMESAAGVFIAEAVLAEVIMIPMGGLCGGPSGLLCLIGAANIFIGEDDS